MTLIFSWLYPGKSKIYKDDIGKDLVEVCRHVASLFEVAMIFYHTSVTLIFEILSRLHFNKITSM